MGKIGSLKTTGSIDKAMSDIRDWLERLNVNGLSVNIQYDRQSNIALLRFFYNGKNYEFRSTKQRDARLNLFAIARVMEYKVRSHIMGIEDFSKSMKSYLMIEGSSMPPTEPSESLDDSEVRKAYQTLQCNPNMSNDELEAQYRGLAKTWHSDMAVSEGAKSVFQSKMSEINNAWGIIKKARGIQ